MGSGVIWVLAIFKKMRNYFTLQILLVMAKVVTNVLKVVETVRVEYK